MADSDLEKYKEATVEKFLEAVQRSKLLSAEQFAQARRQGASDGGADEARRLANWLVFQELLTQWQVDQMLDGKTTFFLGQYKLMERVGSGSMGTVYRANHPVHGTVAIKVLAPALVNHPESIARFQREVRATTTLRHPNIIAAVGAESVGKVNFLVMEYHSGRDLKQWVDDRGPFPIGVACECIRQAALGLQYAFEHGMVHRDVKPANLLVARAGLDGMPVVKVLDLGLARFISESHDSRLTGTGQIIGTPDYVSPEQAHNPKNADTRSDIYSLGCSLFELLTGKTPFPGKNIVEKLMARTKNSAPRIREIRADIPPGLEAVIATMMAKEPGDRYQTPGAVAKALTPYAGKR